MEAAARASSSSAWSAIGTFAGPQELAEEALLAVAVAIHWPMSSSSSLCVVGGGPQELAVEAQLVCTESLRFLEGGSFGCASRSFKRPKK
eukprot:6130853-Lingulodinium_polyedra.AAC.1